MSLAVLRVGAIEAIAVRADHRHAGVPAVRRGVLMRDGTTRPTWDWTPERLPEPVGHRVD